MEKLLSICIPTLDRSVFLNQMLKSIFDQLTPELCDIMEICIDDDSVPDDTEQVVQRYRDRGLIDIVYHRNFKNTGLETAMWDCVAMSSGKYCWIISDDDLVHEGGLQAVVDQLLTDQYDYIIVESTRFDDRIGWIGPAIYDLADEEFINAKEHDAIAEKLFMAMTHVCISIFSRELWDSKGNKEEDTSYKYFTHMKKILQALPDSKKKTKVMSRPVINARAYNYSYANHMLVVFYHHLYRVMDATKCYDQSRMDALRQRIGQWPLFAKITALRQLAFSKAFYGVEGSYLVNYSIYRKIRANLSPKGRRTILMVIATPAPILRAAWRVADKIKQRAEIKERAK